MPIPRQKMKILGGSLCAGLLILTGCTTGGGDGDAAENTDTIRGWWSTDPTTWDPPNTQAIDDYRAVGLLYDTLVRRDLDGELIPGLAESWEQNGNSTVLQIAEGNTCADDTDISPTVVAKSLEYLAGPDTDSTHSDATFGDGDVTVKADDNAGTVTIKLEQPNSDLLAGLAAPQAGVICPAGLDDIDGLEAGTAEGAFSGPYVLKKSNSGVSYDFELREDYDNWPEYSKPLEGTPAKHLNFSIGAVDAVANQLLTGELDVAPIEYHELTRFENNDSFTRIDVETGEHYIMFNHRDSSPFRDKDTRRAAAEVIDREAIQEVINPTTQLITTIGTDKMQCANTDESLLVQPDMDKASKVLDGVSVKVVGSNTVGQNGAGATYVAEQLRAAGAKVKMSNLDVGTWNITVNEEPEKWDITVMGTVNNLNSISWGLGRNIGPTSEEGGRNVSGAINPEASKAFEAALKSDSESEMCKNYKVAQTTALEAVDFIPIATISRPLISREGFSAVAPAGREDLTTLRIVD